MEKEVQPKVDTTKALQEEANKNDAFMAVMYVLANRERTRRNLDLVALQRTMQAHGGDFKKDVYEHVIEFLGKLGLGTVKRTAKGKPVGLTNINTTLQSIGQAAAGKSEALDKFRPAKVTKFKKLPVQPTPMDFVESAPPNQVKAKTRAYSVFLTVMINNAPVVFQGPPNMQPEDLGAFLLNFNNLSKGYGGKGNA